MGAVGAEESGVRGECAPKRVGVGGAGNIMLDNERNRNVFSKKELIYKNGIWHCNTSSEFYNIISSDSSNRIISHVVLEQDYDSIIQRMKPNYIELVVYAKSNSFILEREKDAELLLDFILSTGDYRSVEKELRKEINDIRELELILKKDLGNYRGLK